MEMDCLNIQVLIPRILFPFDFKKKMHFLNGYFRWLYISTIKITCDIFTIDYTNKLFWNYVIEYLKYV